MRKSLKGEVLTADNNKATPYGIRALLASVDFVELKGNEVIN
jgi:hypothetical protein